jgi:hypothetical protein
MQAMTLNLVGDYDTAAQLGQRQVSVSHRHRFAIWRLDGVLHLLANSSRRRELDACDKLVEAVGTLRHVLGVDGWTRYRLTMLAVAEERARRAGESMDSFQEAMYVSAATGSASFSAEAPRGRRDLRFALGDSRGGTADLVAAVELACRQGALSFEQRANAALERASAP